ncbi:hypothetical protein PV327_008455 [Microctonus hyperodae]|uniref:Uncharacterized protein n=1 Tax=Microctonus hyperodae TaxID=165561 RepID=A0AA39F364_MICHY|nr:hypothetical protein PV327_008455 [Microctonus hyperodae]
MSLIKLSSLATQLACRNLLQRLTMSSQNRRTLKTDKNLTVQKTNDNEDDEDSVDQPIKYSTSPAALWTAENSQSGTNNDDIPDCQPPIAIISTATFLIYFVLLREPNDIDEMLEKELGDHVKYIDTGALKRSTGMSTYNEDKKYIK